MVLKIAYGYIGFLLWNFKQFNDVENYRNYRY